MRPAHGSGHGPARPSHGANGANANGANGTGVLLGMADLRLQQTRQAYLEDAL